MCNTGVCLCPQVMIVIEDFLAFMVLFNYVIPISLYVTVGMSL